MICPFSALLFRFNLLQSTGHEERFNVRNCSLKMKNQHCTSSKKSDVVSLNPLTTIMSTRPNCCCSCLFECFLWITLTLVCGYIFYCGFWLPIEIGRHRLRHHRLTDIALMETEIDWLGYNVRTEGLSVMSYHEEVQMNAVFSVVCKLNVFKVIF